MIGEETGVLYQYETSTGIKWKSFGDGKVQPKYKGEIKNGIMDGLGVLIYPYGEKSVVGEWKNGKEWNTKHTKKDGTLIGRFENGEWKLMWGVLFLGWRNGVFGGYKEKWEGVESNDNKNHSKYEGEIEDGFPYGKGTMTHSNGDKLVGEFIHGLLFGQGTRISSNGNKYVGEWGMGFENGQGTWTSPDGSKFIGEFKGGDKWKGTYTFETGGKYVGEWKGGVLPWNGIMYYKNGNIQYRFVNGKIE